MYAYPWEIDIAADGLGPDNSLGANVFRYGNNFGGGYWAIRPFASPIAAGQSFSMDFDQFEYPTLENPSPAESQSLLRFGTSDTGSGESERFALYNYYYNDGTTTYGGDLKWGIGAATAFDNLNGGAPLTAGISGFLTDYTITDSTDGFSLQLDIITTDTYRFRIVDDGITKVDVSGQLDADTAGQGISAMTVWSVGGNITENLEASSYFDNLKIAATPSEGVDGDYNNNGAVDAADYTVWRDNVGGTATLPNDSIGGTIDVDQYNAWRANFGAMGAGAGSSASAVPEPSALLLTALAASAITASFWRGRRCHIGA
jgi:hypothetical protein